jgi:hypothetical protein
MGSWKSKYDNEKSRKRISKFIFWQKLGAFFCKEVLRKMCEKAKPKEKAEKG